mmetsp:Transcript_12814/g.22183  ORF Transcript_12814/g.22183 Transcript_12814/m.22183 type:complete len:170 (-) Transcript_12814:207-716(-)
MSCFDGCFGWLSGAKKSQAKIADEPQLLLPTSKEDAGRSSSRQGSKGYKTESGRFHYSVTGMQLPDSPIKSGGVKYSITGMPLYGDDPAPNKRSGKWSENSASKWGANSTTSNKWGANSSSGTKFGKSGSNIWNSASGKQYSNTGMPMPDNEVDNQQRTKYSITGMPLK